MPTMSGSAVAPPGPALVAPPPQAPVRDRVSGQWPSAGRRGRPEMGAGSGATRPRERNTKGRRRCRGRRRRRRRCGGGSVRVADRAAPGGAGEGGRGRMAGEGGRPAFMAGERGVCPSLHVSRSLLETLSLSRSRPVSSSARVSSRGRV